MPTRRLEDIVHWAMIGDETVGMCWEGDHYPDNCTPECKPQTVSTDILKVTCEACTEHYRTLNDLTRALREARHAE